MPQPIWELLNRIRGIEKDPLRLGEDVFEEVTMEEVARYIDGQFFTRVATVSKHGHLHNIPSNFVRLGNRIYFDADDGSVKIYNIRHNGKICLVWNTGKPFFDARGVMLEGTARLVTDEKLRGEIYDALNEKAFAGLRPSYTEYERQPFPRVRVEVTPTHIVRWHFERGKPVHHQRRA